MIKRPLGWMAVVILLITTCYVYGAWPAGGYPGRQALIDEAFDDGASATISGIIYHKEIKNNQPLYYVKCQSIETSNCVISNSNVIFLFDSDSIPLYSRITATGKLATFDRARNEGNFDEKAYYNSLGIICRIKNGEITENKPFILFKNDLLYQFRKTVRAVYEKALYKEEADLMSAIALGDKSTLDQEVKSLFGGVGLAHLLAISGLHVSVICMSLFKFCRKCGYGFGTSGLTSSIVALMYCIMSGASISTIRAISMFIILMCANMLGVAYDQISALSLVAIVLIVGNPAIITNTGFIFSFSTVVIVRYLVLPVSKGRKGLVGKIAGTLALTLGTIPLMACFYYEIPTYGFVVNLLLVPLLPALLGLGLIGGVIGIYLFPLGQAILAVVHYILFVLEFVSDIFGGLPGSKLIVGSWSLAKIVVFEGILFVAVYVVPKISQSCILSIAAMLASLVIVMAPGISSFEIDVLDVGQGDGIYICDKDGNSFFIDGGSTSEKQVGKYRILPFLKYKGQRNIDYWFISHPDEDHVSGLIEVLDEGFVVKNLVVAQCMRDLPQMLEVTNKAREHGCNIYYMQADDVLRTRTMAFECVYPGYNTKDSDINAMCLCLRLVVDSDLDGREDFVGLFTGDIGKEQEENIIAHYQLTPDNGPSFNGIDYLKVSHHGSKSSTSEKFIDELNPKVATISCARNNSYGHPAKETVDVLENSGTKVFYTMNSGQIKITLDHGLDVQIPILI